MKCNPRRKKKKKKKKGKKDDGSYMINKTKRKCMKTR